MTNEDITQMLVEKLTDHLTAYTYDGDIVRMRIAYQERGRPHISIEYVSTKIGTNVLDYTVYLPDSPWREIEEVDHIDDQGKTIMRKLQRGPSTWKEWVRGPESPVLHFKRTCERGSRMFEYVEE